jgi:hypothetical protein
MSMDMDVHGHAHVYPCAVRRGTYAHWYGPAVSERDVPEEDLSGDRALVALQLGRPPRAFRGVAVRCPYGRPAVTEQAAYDEDGRPFPTTFYVTCPHLVAQLARLEASGGVERWTRAAAADPELAVSLERAHAEQRRIRPELRVGIGGSSRAGSLKCLHAHGAFALARPGYVLGERILAEAEPLFPADGCCMDRPDRR